MTDIDWGTVKFRASSIYKLMTDPKSKEAKERGDLSETTKTYLKEVYIEKIWGLTKDIQNKYTKKGHLCEEDGISLISRLDKVLYVKNETRLENEWFTGTPDIFRGGSIHSPEFIVDNKCSWDAFTFISKLNEPLDPIYEGQMQVYLNLAAIESGRVSYTLCSTPPEIVLEEKRRLAYQMNIISTESREYLDACEYLELSSNYDHIPIQHRHIGFPVQANPDFIEKAKKRVEKSREYLAQLHQDHLKLNK